MTNEEMKNPRQEGQYRGIRCKKAVFSGGGVYSPIHVHE